ncbi:MAG: pilus assembly protein PilP [Xanthomonadaceae bacterium]|nr:pilus assembly protein PilP [Xanthomonadaceae bacterium]MDE2053415.1 pilus assembly protein PilP [Xanthomonadaceae bacterium]
MRPTRIAIALATLAMMSGLAACSGQGDLHEWVAQVKARKGAPLPALPVVKTFETFIYQDQDKRDPFEPAPPQANSADTAGPRPDQNRPREPLEAFPLDSLKMVGTIGAKGSVEALVKDPQGVIHQVHVGDYMGQNYGHVSQVTTGEIDLVELVPNGSGGWMERDATVALGEK